MSDFKTPMDFRKGSYRKYPYQDPTYLSFALLFDFYDVENSPLLAGGAESFLKPLAEQDSFYAERLNDLQNFIKTLGEINELVPSFCLIAFAISVVVGVTVGISFILGYHVNINYL
jgi:hypothetical protein